MKYAIIENNKVINVVLSDAPFSDNWILDVNEVASIDDTWDGTQFVKTSISHSDYKILRENEYPPMEDYLDGIVKGDQSQIQTYINACLAVKAKYPKPLE